MSETGAPVPPRGARAAAPALPVRRPLILNVDDTEIARYTKRRTLEHAGFVVEDATTGREAVERAEALRPALVLLDVRLPDVNGIDVCRQLKQRWPTTMVLQTSATFVSAADRARGLEGGADGYLVQPIDPDELVAAVRALLRLHAAEESTRQLNETLESRIRDRTRDLEDQIAQRERAEAALVQAQKMEAVGQLTGSMAHDFNNILAAMVGYLHLVRRRAGDEAVTALVDKALGVAERGKRLTTRLLAFARNDELQTGPVDVGALLAGMREWLAQTVGSSIRLELEAPAVSTVAISDANQLELAVLNLVINARDAMPSGGRIVLRVHTSGPDAAAEGLPAAHHVVIEVEDSGTGMPPDVARRALEPFFTTKPAGRGTGLGLAQVASVARLSQGTVQIESREGQGTTVSLWLAAGDPSQVLVADDGPPLTGRGTGEHVLLVDDDADILRTLSQLLADSGYTITTAASGSAALKEVEARGAPDLVVTDIAMPDIGGVDLALRLRARHPGLPVLFMSGHAARDRVMQLLPGARLLVKPFRSEDLQREMRRSLEPGNG